MPRVRGWSEDELRKAVSDSVTLADVLRRINLKVQPGNYRTVKMAIEKLGIDTSHFLGSSYLKGRVRVGMRRELDEVMVQNSTYHTQHLKKRLLREGILENLCSACGQLPEWEGKSLVMVLDHINGVNNDHRLENLRLLCPNCNSQTETFCGRKSRKYACVDCGGKVTKGVRCKSCENKRRRDGRPSLAILEKDVEQSGYEGTARRYGVSSKTIRRWVKNGDMAQKVERWVENP